MITVPALQRTGPRLGFGWIIAVVLSLLLPGRTATAASFLQNAGIPQFDVFIGYDGIVREANWFPMVCEVRNAGPAFVATFEITSQSGGGEFVRRMQVELPTDTLKRFSMPMYMGSRYPVDYRAVLRDEEGRVVAELNQIRSKDAVKWDSLLMGAIPASAVGMPEFPDPANRNNYNTGVAIVGRMQPQMIPDNPLALGGLNVVYLNSQRAVDLEEPQVEALFSWLHAGGHLIVGVDAALDVNGVAWLKGLVPGSLGGTRIVKNGSVLEDWIKDFTKMPPQQSGDYNLPFRNLKTDADFASADLRLIEFSPDPSARVEVAIGDNPAVVTALRGRGRVTVLTFNPEQEPVRSWKLRSWFWARAAEATGDYFMAPNNQNSQLSIDSVFGALVDSAQIRKLPVSALLLLLVVYLLVIGPLDQWWLKKINRQMLTWITFPCYVALFSVLIWYIGYRLRAGESEWNELQVVDVLPKGRGAELHGVTYASVYSPVNATYPISGKEPVAAPRPEAYGMTGISSGPRAEVMVAGDTFKAGVTVPVWTSQMVINDWQTNGELLFDASLRRAGEDYEIVLKNTGLPANVTARLVLQNRLYDLEFPAAGQSRTQVVRLNSGTDLASFVRNATGLFAEAAAQRSTALGADEARFKIKADDATMAITLGERYFGAAQPQQPYYDYRQSWMIPRSMDLSWLLDENQALVLVFCHDYAPTEAMNDFQPRRSNRSALLRLSVPMPQ